MLTKKHEFIREKDCCIIAGNGPSLETIDYTRLPREYDVFRCNQFYFEDKYFLGKKIKAYFAVPTIMFYQYYTIKQLVKANQYEIENIFCTTYGFLEEKQFIEKFPILFADAFNGMDILQLHKGIFSEIAQGYFYEHKLITSGVYMCVIAALLGYKELYLSGIDFYVGDKKYAFEATKSNIFQVAGDFGRLGSWHTQSHDLKILKFLESYGIKIYTLSAHSPLKEFFPIAKVSHADLSLSLSATSEIAKVRGGGNDVIKDLLFPEDTQAANRYHEVLRKENNDFMKQFSGHAKQNLYFRLFYDLFRFPKILRNYYKTRKHSKSATQKIKK